MFIKIIRRPEGESPEWVRDAWIGLTLPTPQKRARTWRTVNIQIAQSNIFVRLRALYGRGSHRISGFAVNGRAAVDVLKECQPTAAEWWRANAAKLLAGKGYLVFNADCCERVSGASPAGAALWGPERFKKAYPAWAGRIALLWMMATVLRMLNDILFPADDMRAVSSILFLSGTAVFSAFLAAWVLRLRAYTLHLVSAFVTLDLVMALLSLIFKFVDARSDYFFWFLTCLYVLIVISLIGGGFAGVRSWKRRAAAIFLVIATHLGAGSLHDMDGAFWRLSQAVQPLLEHGDPYAKEDDKGDAAPEVDADVLWGAQAGLVQKQLSILHPRIPNATNVYMMAVAGSGAQALFSREAHEALRVASLHFGNSGRGGVLASNGAADLMKAPLATRENIAAIARGVGEKADHQHDLLFIYLASHGSRTAELASKLPDDQPVQPISAISTADALRQAGVSQRIVVISACFAASWIPALANDDTIIITAAAKDRTSFGCDDSRRLTLFGESFLGSLATRNISLRDAFDDAKRKISSEEARQKVTPSLPQVFVGRNMEALWLGKPAPAVP